MTLNFQNSRRVYQPDRRRICFWGDDDSQAIPFYLEENAIFFLYPRTRNNEAAILEAFDIGSERIFALATKVYAPGQHRASYTLTARQF